MSGQPDLPENAATAPFLRWLYALWAALCAFFVTFPFWSLGFVLAVKLAACTAAAVASGLARRAGFSCFGYEAAFRTFLCFGAAFPLVATAGAAVASISRGETLLESVRLAGGFLLFGTMAGAVAAMLAFPVAVGGTYLFIKFVALWRARGRER